MEDDLYFNKPPEPSKLPDHYIEEFAKSKLVRIRRGNADATLLASNPTFFTLTKGNVVLASVRLVSAFFGRGQFQSAKIERIDNAFILSWQFTWGYFQPLPSSQKPNYDIPFDEDRKRRLPSERQTMKVTVTITENDGIFALDFDLQGTDNVPLTIEFAFRKGGSFEGVERVEENANAYLLHSGTGRFRMGNDEIQFGPGKAEHRWISIRGGLPKPDADCVYLTGFTPCKHKFSIQ
jgi:hypothetical protein